VKEYAQCYLLAWDMRTLPEYAIVVKDIAHQQVETSDSCAVVLQMTLVCEIAAEGFVNEDLMKDRRLFCFEALTSFLPELTASRTKWAVLRRARTLTHCLSNPKSLEVHLMCSTVSVHEGTMTVSHSPGIVVQCHVYLGVGRSTRKPESRHVKEQDA